ncbi:MAG: amidohydrolase family protein [Bacteroidetes bacterium]|nr:amidohydrolase family protein [Bacteroidota bacterium]
MITLVQEKKNSPMQDKYTVIKNGLVLTLDRNSSAGYFTIILKNGRIFFIDCENKFSEKEFVSKNPEAVIIDAKDKMIMPGFFNSALNSSYSLCSQLLNKCSYENLRTWLSLKLVEKFISDNSGKGILSELLKINYLRALKNGEIFLSECSSCISKDLYEKTFSGNLNIKQYHNLRLYDQNALTENIPIPESADSLSLGFIADEELNNYTLSSLRKSLTGAGVKFFVEASISQSTIESVKKIFGKPFISVLSDMELVNSSTVIYNPTHINQIELDILKKKKATVLISPSDYLNLAGRKIDIDELLFSGLNIIIGTGYTGKSILSELKILSNIIPKSSLSYESVLRMAVQNASILFGLSNLTGSVERNKSADLIFFSLKDLRNTPIVPELTGESISEFLIRNLSVKDISDVMIKGEHLINENRLSGINEHELISKTSAISDLLYKAGKFSEYREKYLMRERVDRISLNSDTGNTELNETEPEKKEEIYVDMTETVTYEGEGEFMIKGIKHEEFETERMNNSESENHNEDLKEIKDRDSGINLFDQTEEDQQIKHISVKSKKENISDNPGKTNITDIEENREQEKFVKKMVFDDIQEIDSSSLKKESGDFKDEPAPTFKKIKLKFGFGDSSSAE